LAIFPTNWLESKRRSWYHHWGRGTHSRAYHLALEADGGHTTIGDVALDDVTLDSLGKVCVTLVGRPEKAYFGLTDKVHILGTDRDELGNTTRHFII